MEGQIETPIGFGPDNGLFGILCEPETGEPDIAVIICGGGRNPHYGVGRSAVYLARHLAAAGIASLRMDFCRAWRQHGAARPRNHDDRPCSMTACRI